jgi:hypothetical protein
MITHPEIKNRLQPENNDHTVWNFILGSFNSRKSNHGQTSDFLPVMIKSAEQTFVKPETTILVEQALQLNPYVDHTRVKVLAQGNRITLNGKVKSWFQKEEAARVARLASGNMVVINDIAISYAI